MSPDVGGEWNRDAAYHPWIRRIAAEHAGDVLDVGCGDGLLALQLAEVSRSVVGIDKDPVAIAQAHKRLGMVPNTDAAVSEFGTEWGLVPESYDVITMVSVLHELPLIPTLERVVELLKPGGTLVVVGEIAPETLLDRGVQWVSAPYSRALELFYTWRGMYRPEFASAQPIEPSYSFADVTDAAAELLPGAELHRGLLGRYRLRWAKPVAVASPEVDLGAMAGAVPEESASEASIADVEDARVLARDDVDELSHMFDQTREVPTIESPDLRRSA